MVTENDCGSYTERQKQKSELYQQIVNLHAIQGLSCRKIAANLSIGKSTVSDYIQRWKCGIPAEDTKPNCRPPKINSVARSFLGQLVTRQAQPTSKTLSASLSASKNICVSPRTVRRHLRSMTYDNSVPRPIPLLTDAHIHKRVQWCMEHQDYDWNHVWFSDETYIEVGRATTPVWHREGQRPTAAKRKFAAKIMCWGAVSMRFKSKLMVVEGSMTAAKYIETLRPFFEEDASKTERKRLVFQQDGASSHTAKVTQAFFRDSEISVLAWPPNSPDLNPIENIWSILKQRVEKHAATSKEALIKAVQWEWNQIDTGAIARTIATMRERVMQVIDRQGKKCDY